MSEKRSERREVWKVAGRALGYINPKENKRVLCCGNDFGLILLICIKVIYSYLLLL